MQEKRIFFLIDNQLVTTNVQQTLAFVQQNSTKEKKIKEKKYNIWVFVFCVFYIY